MTGSELGVLPKGRVSSRGFLLLSFDLNHLEDGAAILPFGEKSIHED